ncbi:MAG TPA: aquaporin Z [Pyrinomonadaceae bacterium]|nr:aquaporin Z [Pyrinomonadaceae bacterium]HMP66142.1 aquaporin Z [Pyrinomonadaceae bacterium]
MPLSKRLSAEFLGTLWLVLGGCGSAVLATAYPDLGIGFAGVSLAFGLTVLTGAYALGHISGAHFNPAVTVGLWAGKRFPANEILPYVVAQVLGAIAGAGLIYLIATGKAGFSVAQGFAANGYGAESLGSPGGYAIHSAFVAEVAMTFFFLIVILGATHRLAPKGFAPMAIGLCLTLIHLISIPVTNTSVNPARSTGPALFVRIFGDGWAIEQLWLFWVAPILGAALAGFVYFWLSGDQDASEPAAAKKPVEEAASAEVSDNENDGDGSDGGGNGGGD